MLVAVRVAPGADGVGTTVIASETRAHHHCDIRSLGGSVVWGSLVSDGPPKQAGHLNWQAAGSLTDRHRPPCSSRRRFSC